MDLAALDAATDAFRRGEARRSLAVQRQMKAAFGRYLDPDDVDGSFPRYAALAQALLAAGHAESASAALAYYREARIAAGLPPDVDGLVPATFSTDGATTSLRVTGPVTIKRLTAKGRTPAQAAVLAQAATLRAAKRVALNGARKTLVEAARRDPDAIAWARVSDGGPCAFCAMLVSRGPVYSGSTVGFEAHDGCGCVPRPVFRGDPTGGWTPQANAYRQLWDDARTGKHVDEHGRPIYDFRYLVEQVREGKYALAA